MYLGRGIARVREKIKRFFTQNLLLKVTSLLIGVVAWFSVVTVIDDTTVEIIYDIPIEINLEDSQAKAYALNVVDGANQTTNITVKGTRVRLAGLSSTDFSASAFANAVSSPGEYTLNVTVGKRNVKDQDFDIIGQSVSTINAKFDFITEKVFPIEGVAENIKAKEGYIKDKIIVNPEKLTVKGPRSEIDKIAKVTVSTNLEAVESDAVQTSGKLGFYDEKGNFLTLNNVTYLDNKFTLTVPIFKQKEVPLKVNYVNVPVMIDIDEVKHSMSSSSIKISGPEKIVNAIDYLTVGEIDFRRVDIGSVFELDIELPAGVTNSNDLNSVIVKFNDPNLSSVDINITNIFTKNESANFDVVVQTNSIKGVKIVGNKNVLEGISPSDFVATLDLLETRLSEGSMRVPITIYAIDKKQAWAVGEYFIELTVTKKAK